MMAEHLNNFVEHVTKMNVLDPAKRIWESGKTGKSVFDKGTRVIATTGKELVLLPVYNAVSIMNWTRKKALNLLEGTLKLGGKSLMLVPLPFPNANNIAAIRGSIVSHREAMEMTVLGNGKSFKENLQSIARKNQNAEPTKSTMAI